MVGFRIVLRGYDRIQVDEVVGHVVRGLGSADPKARAEVREAVREPRFRVVLRGYDRDQVDTYLEDAQRRLS